MTEERADTIVVGLGAMGSAACYHLARRGADVVGFDAHDVPNEMGSSGGESRIIRMCYFEHPDYVPLLKRAYELWHELAGAAHQPIIEITGGVFIGAPESGLVYGSRRAAEEHMLPHEMLSNAELRQRFPQFQVRDDMVALYEPTGGFLRPELAVAAHARLAQQHGARLFANEPVLEWSATNAGVVVQTRDRTVHAQSLIMCAGPWTTKLVSAIAATLTVTRQVLAWVQPKQPELFQLGSCPVWAVEHHRGDDRYDGSPSRAVDSVLEEPGYQGADFHYGFPIIDPRKGLKLGRHEPATPADPDRLTRTPLPGDEDTVRGFLRTHLPAADGPLRDIYVCMYTNTPDAHFIIDRHPAHANVHIATGFSGHGFKFATVVGEALADLAQHGGTMLPIGFLGLHRFC
jgi:sarcosine oxidase